MLLHVAPLTKLQKNEEEYAKVQFVTLCCLDIVRVRAGASVDERGGGDNIPKRYDSVRGVATSYPSTVAPFAAQWRGTSRN